MTEVSCCVNTWSVHFYSPGSFDRLTGPIRWGLTTFVPLSAHEDWTEQRSLSPFAQNHSWIGVLALMKAIQCFSEFTTPAHNRETVFASCDSWTKRLMVEPVFWQGFALRSSEPSLRLCGHWFLGGLDDEVLRSEKTHFSLTPLVLCTKCAQPLSDKHLCTQAIVVMRYPAAKMLQSLINLISVFIINIYWM